MTATPLADLGAELRNTRPDLLKAACGGDGSDAALAAFLARPGQAEYFRLADGEDGQVKRALIKKTHYILPLTPACPKGK